MIYELDVSKWKSGNEHLDPDNVWGVGITALLNDDGYMCCLGQFALQKGVAPETLLNKDDPNDIDVIYDENFQMINDLNELINTPFANHLIQHNDRCGLTPLERINKIRSELRFYGHDLIIKNEHLLDEFK